MGVRHGVECIVFNSVEVNHVIVWSRQYFNSVDFQDIVRCPISKWIPFNSVESIPRYCWGTKRLPQSQFLLGSQLRVTPLEKNAYCAYIAYTQYPIGNFKIILL